MKIDFTHCGFGNTAAHVFHVVRIRMVIMMWWQSNSSKNKKQSERRQRRGDDEEDIFLFIDFFSFTIRFVERMRVRTHTAKRKRRKIEDKKQQMPVEINNTSLKDNHH